MHWPALDTQIHSYIASFFCCMSYTNRIGFLLAGSRPASQPGPHIRSGICNLGITAEISILLAPSRYLRSLSNIECLMDVETYI